MWIVDFIKKLAVTGANQENYAITWHNNRVECLKNEFTFLQNNPYSHCSMQNSELRRLAKLINESDRIIETSECMNERLRRCEFCIDALFKICACFQTERDYAVSLSNALETYERLKKGDLPSITIQEYFKKVDNLTFDEVWDSLSGSKQKTIPRIPTVDGIPVYEYAETHKHDFEIMYRCCIAVLKESCTSKTTPAPHYFWRCAVLSKKAKRYDIEVKVCESYLEFVDRYCSEMTADGKTLGKDCLDISQGPRVADMRKRLPKARVNLAKQQAAKIENGLGS
ncbi:hypothetical protein [Solidesulfovibrio sp. C21]|uniref:hypothetical protein n=1 Tax=Solidesulfovibrio sp. C21 TaxID=3398613 RepID=UPI0039FCAD18